MNEETKQLLEDVLTDKLVDLKSLTGGTEEHKDLTNDVKQLATILNEAEKNELDAFDRQERRRIDEEKNRSMTAVEMTKAETDWKKVLIEFGKIVIPSVISIYAYDVFQKRILKFEENGRLTTTASRELHLPKFFK